MADMEATRKVLQICEGLERYGWHIIDGKLVRRSGRLTLTEALILAKDRGEI